MALKHVIKNILILILTLNIISCTEIKNNKGDKMMNIIPYGTDEYNTYIKENSKITKEEARNIKNNFIKENYNGKIIGAFLCCIIDDNYVFTNYYIPKLMESSTKGIWVNIKNGKIKYQNTDIKVPLITEVWNDVKY